jgi:hypothetical protein
MSANTQGVTVQKSVLDAIRREVGATNRAYVAAKRVADLRDVHAKDVQATLIAKITSLEAALEIASSTISSQAGEITELEQFSVNAIAVIKQAIDAEMERKETEKNAPPLSWSKCVSKITLDGKVLTWDAKTFNLIDPDDGEIIGKMIGDVNVRWVPTLYDKDSGAKKEVLVEKTSKWVASFNDDSSDEDSSDDDSSDDDSSDEDAFGQFAPGVAGHGGEEEEDNDEEDDDETVSGWDSDDDWRMYDYD